ncbi:MAG TPA: glycosyltransferase [Ferruginibacter sp.]|nr:glycosyltransferase [Ferruginibacter sp.]HRO16574.1 glycosyltransferase [Ferruginibacter sp.]HRQ19917.1 glycosyltransferase [Ferruginibacter sp.]
MTDIIFISFEFPPLSAGGIFRSKEFAKNLPAEGITPHVYCLSPDHYENVYPGSKKDEQLLNDLSGRGVRIIPVPIDPIWNLYNTPLKRFWNIYFSIYRGNEHRKWKHHLFRKIKEDAATVNFKAVLVTAPPFGMLPLALEVAKVLGLPLILDMRDAWAFWNSTGFGTYLHYLTTVKKERELFRKADVIIATSEQTITDWIGLHPSIPSTKYTCITNGFNEEIVNEIKTEITVKPIPHSGKFDIVYVGSFYFSPETRENMLTPALKRKRLRKLQYYPRIQDWLYRSPHFFLKAVARLFEIEPGLRKHVKIKFAGHRYKWLDDMVAEFGLQNEVVFLGFMKHAEALELQKAADALLITSAKVYNGRDCFIAGKTFEYITMNRPIFSFVSEGAQKDILKDTGLSIEFEPDNTEEAALKLNRIFTEGLKLKPNVPYIETFGRKKLTKKLADTIKEVIEKRNR